MHALGKLIALLTVFYAQSTLAQRVDVESCDDAKILVLAHHLKVADLTDGLASSWCKAWPHRKGVSLAAVAYDAGISDKKALLVATINRETNSVLGTYQASLVDDDHTKVNVHSLRLDTAAYRLNNKTFAFGLRTSVSSGATCVDGRVNEELTLLVPDGSKLRPVLTIPMLADQALEGCLPRSSRKWETAEMSIRIGRTCKNGFADLVVIARISTWTDESPPREYRPPRVEERLERSVLRYDGTRYYEDREGELPWWRR